MKLEKEESLCLAYFQSSKAWERLLEGFKKKISFLWIFYRNGNAWQVDFGGEGNAGRLFRCKFSWEKKHFCFRKTF